MQVLEVQALSQAPPRSPAVRVRFWLTVCYLLSVVVCFSAVYVVLNTDETRAMRFVQGGTLLYDSKQPFLGPFLAAAHQVHLRTLDLAAPGAGLQAQLLTGSQSAESPSLVIPNAGTPSVVTSPSALLSTLQYAQARSSPYELGKTALLLMLFIIAIALVFSREGVGISGFLPALGILSVGVLAGHCLHCQFTSPLTSTLAPLVGLAYTGAGLLLFTHPVVRQKLPVYVFLAGSVLVPLAQAKLQLTEPKLCPACLLFTCMSASYFVAAREAILSAAVSGVRVPRPLVTAMAVLFLLVLGRHLLNLGGHLLSFKLAETAATSIIGDPLAKHIRSTQTPQAGVLYVVGTSECPYCQRAVRDLNASKIPLREISPCTNPGQTDCLDGSGMNFSMPMLLVSDRQGMVIYENQGWDGSSQLMTEITDALARSVKKGVNKPQAQ